MSVVSTSAPFERSNSAILSCPSWAATCNGVFSTFVRASRWHPDRSSISAVSRCPYCAARCSGDVPSQSVVIGAPLANSRLTSALSPSLEALNSCLPSSTREALVRAALPPGMKPIPGPMVYTDLTWTALPVEVEEDPWPPMRVTTLGRLGPLLTEWPGTSICRKKFESKWNFVQVSCESSV